MMDKHEPTVTGSRKKTFRRLKSACAAALVSIFLLDLSITPGVAVGVLYLVVVLITLRTPLSTITLTFAIVSSLLILLAFFVKLPVEEMWKVVMNRGISLLAIWVTAVLGLWRNAAERQRVMLLHEREKALQEVKILRGLLPICSSCKRIRDDHGYWLQLEDYIKNNSEAEFTHTICPECAENLYPDFYKPK